MVYSKAAPSLFDVGPMSLSELPPECELCIDASDAAPGTAISKGQRLRSETRDAASSWLFSPLAHTDDPGIVETRALERDASTQWHLWQRLGTIEEIPQLTRLLAGAVFTSLVVPLSVAVHRGHLREHRDCAERSGRFAGMVRPTGLVGPVRLGSATTPLPARRAR